MNNIAGVITVNSHPVRAKITVHPTISTNNFWDFQVGSMFKVASSPPNDLASPSPGDDYRNADCKYT